MWQTYLTVWTINKSSAFQIILNQRMAEKLPNAATFDFRELCERYHDGFEKAFAINPLTGNIACIDKDVEMFYNSYTDLIQNFTGFKPPAISSLKDDNRIAQLTRAYAYAFIVYRKLNNLYSKRNDPRYSSELFIEA
jgi:hypothetical protein